VIKLKKILNDDVVSRAAHNYPDAKLTKEFFEDWVLNSKTDFNALENDKKCIIYRLSEIESIQIEK